MESLKSDDDSLDLDYTINQDASSTSDSDLDTPDIVLERSAEEQLIYNQKIDALWQEIKHAPIRIERKETLMESYLKSELNGYKQFQFAGETYSARASDLLDLGKSDDPQAEPTVEPMTQDSSVPAIGERGAKHLLRKSNLPGLLKRYNLTDQIRLNTLEKSKLDWQKFTAEEGIAHELASKNRDGYVEKRDFLQRTEQRVDDIAREQKQKTKRR